MGAAHSSINQEAGIAGAVVAGSIAVLAAYQFINQKKDDGGAKGKQPQAGTTKKGKKKGTAAKDDDDEFEKIIAAVAAENAAEAASSKRATAVASSEVVPGSFEAADHAGAADSDAAAKKDKKKSKKKAKKAGTAMATSASSVGDADGETESGSARGGSRTLPIVTSIEESIVHVPADGPSEPARKEKGKKKKSAKPENATAGSQTSNANASASNSGPSSSPKSLSTPKPKEATTGTFDDGSWTRVSSRKGASGMQQSLSQSEIMTSDTNLTASGTGDTETSSVGSAKADAEDEEDKVVKRKTFAEKMLPKRRTGVEDMEEEPLQPAIARVIRITPGPNDKPAKGFSWADYEDVDTPGGTSPTSSRQPFVDGETSADADGDDDEGWVVKSRRRTKFERTPSSSSAHQGNHAPSSAPETITKRQRQNIARREAQKADKNAQEAERLARLAKHKKEVEKVKIDEQWKHGGGGKKSGGMVASVDEKGGLVWE